DQAGRGRGRHQPEPNRAPASLPPDAARDLGHQQLDHHPADPDRHPRGSESRKGRPRIDVRTNPLTGVPVVVAPGRSRRPGAQGRTTRIADAATCPFCEGHEEMTPPEVQAFGRPESAAPDSPGWTVRVVPNKFPAIPGQEVVIHGPAHVLSFAELPTRRLRTTAEAWRARRAAHADAAWTAVAVNEGPAAGASLDHSHSQIV